MASGVELPDGVCGSAGSSMKRMAGIHRAGSEIMM
jgi:hypothetical protein